MKGLINKIHNKFSKAIDKKQVNHTKKLKKKNMKEEDPSKVICFLNHDDEKEEYPAPYLEIAKQLQSESLELRCFVIDSLAKIASANKKFELEIMQILTDFIIKKSQNNKDEEVSVDILEAFRVIGKRSQNCIDSLQINLSGAYLKDVNIENGNFSNIDFSNANLSGAIFIGHDNKNNNPKASNFSNCNFSNANLSYARFMDVDFSHADLSSANLKEIKIVRSNCSFAIFRKSKIDNCVFMESTFDDADFRNVDISTVKNLSSSQLKNIRKNKNTKLPWGIDIEK